MTNTLSASLEDYLEIILDLSEKEIEARITDIAERLNIAKASVSQAIKHLKELGLIEHEKYGAVALTDRGRQKAIEVRRRHKTISRFLVEVLGVDPKIAEKDACLMEHVVSPQTFERLVEFLGTYNNISYKGKGEKNLPSVNTKSLDELMPGTKGKVIKIGSKGHVRRKLLDMGLTPGAEFNVKGAAPMGDPIEIEVKGYCLTLRKKEAANIFVEVL